MNGNDNYGFNNNDGRMLSLPKLNVGRENKPSLISAFTTEFDFDNNTRGYLHQQNTDNDNDSSSLNLFQQQKDYIDHKSKQQEHRAKLLNK